MLYFWTLNFWALAARGLVRAITTTATRGATSESLFIVAPPGEPPVYAPGPVRTLTRSRVSSRRAIPPRALHGVGQRHIRIRPRLTRLAGEGVAESPFQHVEECVADRR